MALRPPTVVFPVASTTTLAPLAAPPAHGSGGAAKAGGGDAVRPLQLRDALLLKPMSTVGDAFDVCKRCSPPLLSGDFVRAEARAVSAWHERLHEDEAQGIAARPVPVRREDLAGSAGAILRIQSNRKSQWQQQGR